jgi:hypothetical protein
MKLSGATKPPVTVAALPGSEKLPEPNGKLYVSRIFESYVCPLIRVEMRSKSPITSFIQG